MGANVSRQITEITEKAVTSTTVEFAQTAATEINNTQIVEISDVEGNVEIGELNLSQRVEVNLSQSMNTLSNSDAQLKLADKILQESKQMVSGISLAQANYAEKNMRKIVDVLYEFSSSVAQRCAATAQQRQEIRVRGVKGSLSLQRVMLSQVTGLVSACVQDATSQNKSVAELSTEISQRTEQTLKGIDPVALMGLLALGMLGVPLIAGGLAVMYLGPILVVAGVGICGWSLMNQKTEVELKLYSGLYNADGFGKTDVTVNFYGSEGKEPALATVVAAFERDVARGFDLDRCNKKVYMYTDPAVTTLPLSTQDLAPCPRLVKDKTAMRNGDVFFDKTTGDLVRKCGDKHLFVQKLDKTKSYKLEKFRVIDASDNTEVPISDWPEATNVSGWKVTRINKLILLSGVICIVAGFILLVVQRFQKKKQNNPKQP